jgi:hypothetical protein
MSKELASTDLVIKLPAVMTAETFTDDKEFEKLYANILEAVKKHKPDVSTAVGREAIASLAYKVARTKTALDNQGKALTDEWRKSTQKVNDTRNIIKDRLDALKEEVRSPLTAWEDAEKARVEAHTARLADLVAMSKVGFGRTSSELRELLAKAEAVSTSKDVWEEYAPQAGVAREDAVDTLKRLLATAEKQEREAAELEQLRAEKAERDRIEAERIAAEHAAEMKRDYARRLIEHVKQCALGFIDGKSYPYPILFRELEEKVVADEACGDLAGEVEAARLDAIERLQAGWKAEQERAALAAEQEKVRAAEEAKQRAEREAQEKIEAAKLAAAEAEERHAKALRDAEETRQREAEEAKRREAEAAERHAREVADAKARADREAAAERKRIADAEAAEIAAQKARDADKEHRKSINTAIVRELIECSGISETAAKKIVTQIALGHVPNVTLKY